MAESTLALTVGMVGSVFELRTYTPAPGRLDDLARRFRDHTLRLFERHGIDAVAFWETLGDGEPQLVYLLRFESLPAAETAWDSFKNDPEWIAARAASVVNGELTTAITSIWLAPSERVVIPRRQDDAATVATRSSSDAEAASRPES